MTTTVNILNLLFQFLKIKQCCGIGTISNYLTPQDQILNLFLIPHIILFLFIYGFAWVLVPTHRGLRYLASIGAYLSIVMMNVGNYSYYGILLPFFLMWWQIALFVGLFFFLWSRVIHPSKVPELFNIGRAAAAKATAKGKRNEAIEKQIESIEHQIRALQSQKTMTEGNMTRDNPYVVAEIAELSRRKAELEKELS